VLIKTADKHPWCSNSYANAMSFQKEPQSSFVRMLRTEQKIWSKMGVEMSSDIVT